VERQALVVRTRQEAELRVQVEAGMLERLHGSVLDADRQSGDGEDHMPADEPFLAAGEFAN